MVRRVDRLEVEGVARRVRRDVQRARRARDVDEAEEEAALVLAPLVPLLPRLLALVAQQLQQQLRTLLTLATPSASPSPTLPPSVAFRTCSGWTPFAATMLEIAMSICANSSRSSST